MERDYWLEKTGKETPEEEVNLIFQTTDFTLAESGKLPTNSQEYCNIETARLMTELLVSIMEQKMTLLSSASITRIKRISAGLEKAYTSARTQASSKIKEIGKQEPPKTIMSSNGQELELPIPLSPSLRITRVSMTYDEHCVNNPWYKRVWAYLNKPFTSK